MAVLLPACLCLMTCGCACNGKKAEAVKWLPPENLLADIRVPDRGKIRTVGDMALIILEDEKEMRLKNADLEALRKYSKALEARQ